MQQKALTKRSTDHSDARHFSFSFNCDKCGREWVSSVQPFTGGMCTNVEHDEALKLLWANEHRAAFAEANLDARMQFNRCPVCGRWVCDECFDIRAAGNGELCRECRENIT
jgi:predicted RNA-binding Zn-ribbon protein involved in translation (DUF1610 family)